MLTEWNQKVKYNVYKYTDIARQQELIEFDFIRTPETLNWFIETIKAYYSRKNNNKKTLN